MEKVSQKARIVAIDDDPKVLELVTACLHHDYKLDSFLNPEEAIEAFETGLLPDLILCDIMMPHISGFDLHSQVRLLPNHLSVPFLYLTALDDHQYFRKGMLLGADDYITKPFLPYELREAVAARLEKVRLLRQESQIIQEKALHIQTMGGFEASFAGERLQWNIKKSAAALLLLLSSEDDVPIETIKREIWWESVVDNSVHVLNLRLRKIVEDFAELKVRKGKMSLVMQYPVVWDIQNFENDALQALEDLDFNAVENAIQLYRGEFLPNFDVPWTEHRRHYYEDLYIKLLETSLKIAPNETSRVMAAGRLERYLNG
ncbi:MAG: response regulator [Deinococcales bacterium]